MFTATARTFGDGLTSEVEVNGRHTIVTDEPETIGGTDLGPAPHELLPAMVASCVSTMIVLHARTRGWELEEVRVDVTYDEDTVPHQTRIRIHLPATLDETQIQRLTRVADRCPVKRALEDGFRFERSVIIEAGGALSGPRQAPAAPGRRRGL